MASRKIGVIGDRFARPLVSGLGPPGFVTVPGSGSTELALELRQGNLDCAFLSPIEYARDYRLYEILPEVAAVSEGPSGLVLLLFREGGRTISTIAADPRSGSEIVLAHIVLAEKYETVPRVVPYAGSPGEAFRKADGVLLFGDAAEDNRDGKKAIDLIDEWGDIAEVPYVHGFWVVRRDVFTTGEARKFIRLSSSGTGKAAETAGIRYTLDEAAISGLTEFFRMAYYHGVLRDIPDIRLFALDP